MMCGPWQLSMLHMMTDEEINRIGTLRSPIAKIQILWDQARADHGRERQPPPTYIRRHYIQHASLSFSNISQSDAQLILCSPCIILEMKLSESVLKHWHFPDAATDKR